MCACGAHSRLSRVDILLPDEQNENKPPNMISKEVGLSDRLLTGAMVVPEGICGVAVTGVEGVSWGALGCGPCCF